jgi:hypothetical protein
MPSFDITCQLPLRVGKSSSLQLLRDSVDEMCPGLRKKSYIHGTAEEDPHTLEVDAAFDRFRQEFADSLVSKLRQFWMQIHQSINQFSKQGFLEHLDEEEIMTNEELELLLLFSDDGATDEKGDAVATADTPKELTEDWHQRWNEKNGLTIRLIRLLKSTNFDFDSKSMGLQILRNLALHEVRKLAVCFIR